MMTMILLIVVSVVLALMSWELSTHFEDLSKEDYKNFDNLEGTDDDRR
jgi:regulatory protein YycH of two-component signal transduction system YycFG